MYKIARIYKVSKLKFKNFKLKYKLKILNLNCIIFKKYLLNVYVVYSSELQLEIKKREQRKLEEEQEELEKWRKKIQDRQREDEEFKVCIL